MNSRRTTQEQTHHEICNTQDAKEQGVLMSTILTLTYNHGSKKIILINNYVEADGSRLSTIHPLKHLTLSYSNLPVIEVASVSKEV